MKVKYFIVSIFMWLVVLITMPLMFLIVFTAWLLTFWFDKRLYVMNFFNSVWGSMYVWMNPIWKVKRINFHKYKKRESVVLIGNHQSMVDIPIMYHLFPVARWVSKTENFKVPFLGWAMRLAKAIEIKRGKASSIKQMMEQSHKALQEGATILIFAEGTRCNKDDVLPLRSGAFELAIKNKKDIVPVVHYGTGKALPKHGFFLRNSQKMIVEVLDPIRYEDFKDMTPSDLAKQTHKIMQDKYFELKEQL